MTGWDIRKCFKHRFSCRCKEKKCFFLKFCKQMMRDIYDKEDPYAII